MLSSAIWSVAWYKYRHIGRKYKMRVYCHNMKTEAAGSFATWLYIYKAPYCHVQVESNFQK